MKSFEGVPQVPLSRNELKAIDRVLYGYLSYIKATTMQTEHILRIEGIKNKIEGLLSINDDGSCAPLTFDEVETLLEAIQGFGELVRKIIPPSEDRQSVLDDLAGVRCKLMALQASLNEEK